MAVQLWTYKTTTTYYNIPYISITIDCFVSLNLPFYHCTIASVVNGLTCYSCSYYENEIKRDYECVVSPANVTTANTVQCPDDSYCFTQIQYYKGKVKHYLPWSNVAICTESLDWIYRLRRGRMLVLLIGIIQVCMIIQSESLPGFDGRHLMFNMCHLIGLLQVTKVWNEYYHQMPVDGASVIPFRGGVYRKSFCGMAKHKNNVKY